MNDVQTALVKVYRLHAEQAQGRRYNWYVLAGTLAGSWLLVVLAAFVGFDFGVRAAGAVWHFWPWFFLAVGLLLTVPGAVLLTAFCTRAMWVELSRMDAEIGLFQGDLPEIVIRQSPDDSHLQPGIVFDGEQTVSPIPHLSPSKRALRDACLALIQHGITKGKFTRSALAEGEGAVMAGDAWDMASPELQRHGWFVADNKGLRPALHFEHRLEEVILRLENAT